MLAYQSTAMPRLPTYNQRCPNTTATFFCEYWPKLVMWLTLVQNNCVWYTEPRGILLSLLALVYELYMAHTCKLVLHTIFFLELKQTFWSGIFCRSTDYLEFTLINFRSGKKAYNKISSSSEHLLVYLCLLLIVIAPWCVSSVVC